MKLEGAGATAKVSPTVQSITTFTASQLARRIAVGELSALEVVDAHISRIEVVNPQINALVQPLFEEARAAAVAADNSTVVARRKGIRLPALHGVPVTVKDCFDVRGTDCTLGLDTRVGHPAEFDAPLVSRLRLAGAILLGKSNVHQGMLMHEADNPVFGRTNHPTCQDRTPGGSSGGEAAIVAARGSALGLASDLGGSIRQPAHSCGICGLKPTTGRLTRAGGYLAIPGMQAIALQPGPLVRSVEDIDLAMRVLVDKSQIPRQDDECCDPWPDFRAVSVKDLKIGWFNDDGYFRPSPAIRRAVDEAAQTLRGRGAQLYSFPLPDVREMMRAYMGLVSADGLRSLVEIIRGSRREPQVAYQLRVAGLPRVARLLLRWTLPLFREDYLVDLLNWTGARSAKQYWDLTVAADAYRKRFQQHFGGRAGGVALDALVMPVHGLPALRHGTACDVLPAAGYCFLANLLGWPSGVLPLTTVRANEECERQSKTDRVIRTARRIEAGSAGLPIGVQVLAPPWREDVVLAVMAVLENHPIEHSPD